MEQLVGEMGKTPPGSPAPSVGGSAKNDIQMGGTSPTGSQSNIQRPGTPMSGVQMGGNSPSASQSKLSQPPAPSRPDVGHDQAIKHVVGSMNKATSGKVQFDEDKFRANYKQKLESGIQKYVLTLLPAQS